MINETIKTLKNRRSTRLFLDKKVPKEILEEIIECGFYAPSSYNTQGWYFTVVEDRKRIDVLNAAAKIASKTSKDPNLIRISDNKSFDIFYHAPVIIIVSGDQSALTPRTDCVLASQNILLAAESLGLGSCWNGIVKWLFESDQADIYKEIFKIPDTYEPYHAIAIGYKAREYSTFPARDVSKVTFIS